MDLRTRMDGLRLPAERHGSRVARALGVLASIGLWLALTQVASASTSLTWTGGSPGRTESAAHWSAGANWEGDAPPTTSQAITTLTFPRLTNSECASEPQTDTCYLSLNDIGGLSAESMQLDDSDDYFLAGEGLTLGSGGLTATPAGGESGAGGAFMLMPLRLSAPQKWSIADRSGGKIEENGLLLGEELTSDGSQLTVELSNGPALVLENSTAVGPLKIEGANATQGNSTNGSVLLDGGELNAANDQTVDLSHVFFAGAGAVGALTTNHATVVVGSETESAGGLEASSVKLDPETGMVFEVTKSGTTAQVDYSQLVVKGPTELAGPIVVLARQSAKTGTCPTLSEGQKYTLLSTTGPLSGTFGNASEGGPEIKIAFERGCEQLSQTMRISYARSGDTETVTGTVEAQAKERQEEEAKQRLEDEAKEKAAREKEAKQKEEATAKLAEEHVKNLEEAVQMAAAAAGRSAEAAVAARKHQEEETAANRRREEETTARGGVLAAKEEFRPKSSTRAQLLAKGLKQCKKQPKKKRAKCEAAVRKKYGSKAKSGNGR